MSDGESLEVNDLIEKIIPYINLNSWIKSINDMDNWTHFLTENEFCLKLQKKNIITSINPKVFRIYFPLKIKINNFKSLSMKWVKKK